MNNNQNPQSEHWKVFALFFKEAMQAKGLKASQLAKQVDLSPSTITRFFNLEFCLKFDAVLKIVHALDLNLFFETRDQSAEMSNWADDQTNYLKTNKMKEKRNLKQAIEKAKPNLSKIKDVDKHVEMCKTGDTKTDSISIINKQAKAL